VFTGLIEDVGRVVEVSRRRGSTRIGIATSLPVASMHDGESVAVDGVCLTVAARRRDRLQADAVAETLSRTTLASLRPGARVHLERALAVGDRLGGHFVAGHVDATARVRRLDRAGDDVRLLVELPAGLERFVAEKGSIAVRGVSLTVSAVRAGTFEVAVVPETLARTLLGSARPGEPVNVEVDLVARYLERIVSSGSGWSPPGPESEAP